MRQLLTTVLGFVIAGLTVLAIAGSSRFDGPVLWRLSDRHGLHLGDLAVVVVGVVGLLTLAALRRADRLDRAPSPSDGDRVAYRPRH